MDDVEWALKKPKVVVLKDGVHDDKSLNEFLIEEENIRDPMDTVQYKLILIPDYQEDKSIIILKSHHSLADGMGYASFMQSLNDKYDSEDLPGLK